MNELLGFLGGFFAMLAILLLRKLIRVRRQRDQAWETLVNGEGFVPVEAYRFAKSPPRQDPPPGPFAGVAHFTPDTIDAKLIRAILRAPLTSHGDRKGDFYIGLSWPSNSSEKGIAGELRNGLLAHMLNQAKEQRGRVIGSIVVRRAPGRSKLPGLIDLKLVCRKPGDTKPNWSGR